MTMVKRKLIETGDECELIIRDAPPDPVVHAEPDATAEQLYNAYWNRVKLNFAVPPPSYIQLDDITRAGWNEAAAMCNLIHEDPPTPPPNPEP